MHIQSDVYEGAGTLIFSNQYPWSITFSKCYAPILQFSLWGKTHTPTNQMRQSLAMEAAKINTIIHLSGQPKANKNKSLCLNIK